MDWPKNPRDGWPVCLFPWCIGTLYPCAVTPTGERYPYGEYTHLGCSHNKKHVWEWDKSPSLLLCGLPGHAASAREESRRGSVTAGER